MNPTLAGWLRQPTTIHGIAALAALACGFLAWFGMHSTEAVIAISGAAYGGVNMLMNDSTAEPSSVEKLVVDAVTAATQKHIAEALPALIQDGLGVVRDLSPPPMAPKPMPVVAGGAATIAALLLCLGLSLSACVPSDAGAGSGAPSVAQPIAWSGVVKNVKPVAAALDRIAATVDADPAVDPVLRARIQVAVSGLDGVVAMLDGAAQPANARQVASDVLNGVNGLVQIIPVVPPDVQLLVGIGTPMLEAFINTLPAPN